jgi:hypothetical protein
MKNEVIDITEQQKKEAAYALNLCTVSVSQIVDYNDIYVLEQEYDAILNNLNIQNIIHDEALLSVLKKILDAITFFKIQEGDKKFIEKEQQAKVKNAIWSAVPSLSVIIAGGNPVTMAVGIATQIGIGYMSYRKSKSEAQLTKERQEWELQRAAIEQFSALQRELFETAWRLSDAYHFDDRYRLTEKQIKRYNAILTDTDPLRRYERLDTQKHIFEAFPPFWYYKGNAAKEVAERYKNNPDIAGVYKAKALEDYQKFDSIYVELMREDVIAASCALEHIALLDKNADEAKIQSLLDRTMRLAGDNFDVLQIGVLHYISLGKNAHAKDILRHLVNEDYNVSFNGLLLSRMYCKWDKNKVEYDILRDRIGEQNVIPWVEDDLEADKKYIENREAEILIRFNQFVDTFGLKYKMYFEKSLGYNHKAKMQKLLDWCSSTDITQVMVDTSNTIFETISGLGIFMVQPHLNDKTWEAYFKEQSLLLADKIRTFNAIQSRVKKSIAELTGKPGFNPRNLMKSNEPDTSQEKLKTAVEVLYKSCGFTAYITGFFDNLKKEFRENLSVESLVNRQDDMNMILDKWYMDNGFEIPAYSDSSETIQRKNQEVIFFEYPAEEE